MEILVFFYGSLLASFAHLVAERLLRNETIMGRSYCDHCHHTLRWFDVLPIVGYLINGGKCHFCKAKIHYRHLLIEILAGVYALIGYLLIGPSLEYLVFVIGSFVLLIESIIDARAQLVFDRVWIIGVIPLIVLKILQGSLITHLISSFVLFLSLYLLAIIYEKVAKKEALGGGDIKLYFFIGWLIDVRLGLLSLFIASLIGLLYAMIKKSKYENYLPLVPFISIAVLVVYYWGDWMIDSYLHLLGI